MTKVKNIEIVEEQRETVTDIKFEQLIPNVIDNYLITIFEDHHTILLPPTATSSQFRAWYKGKGGVFSKDVLNYSLKKPHGKYVLIKSKSLSCVARIVTEDEELNFRAMKLVDGQIKDRPYMILKKVEDGEKLSTTQRYINENDIEQKEEEYLGVSEKTGQDDEVNDHLGSISLFSE